MSTSWKIIDQQQPYFLTSTIVDWVDVFTRKTYRDLVIESLDYCIKNKNMILYSYGIMSNHLHYIVQCEKNNLSNLIRDFKKYTSIAILDAVQKEPESRRDWMLHRFSKPGRENCSTHAYQVWQSGNHAEVIYSENFLWTKLDYIHLNPVRAGMVERASHYVYSSASNYVTGKGILNSVNVVDSPVVDVTKPGNFMKYHLY